MGKEHSIDIGEIYKKLTTGAIIRDFGFCNGLYHGTKRYYAQKILKTKELEDTDDGHLGSGFYCYFLEPECCEKWARDKYNGEAIAILILKANLCNIFYISEKRYNILKDFAEKEYKGFNNDIDITIGYIIEKVIKEFINEYIHIDIDTVCRYRTYSGIKVLAVSLRNQRITQIEIWEPK